MGFKKLYEIGGSGVREHVITLFSFQGNLMMMEVLE